MQGNDEVLSYLDQYLSIELTGNKQYFLHSRKCNDWGFNKLATIQNDYSQEEMQHANRILERILLLGGNPTLKDARVIEVKDSVKEQLELDFNLITHAIKILREAVACSEKAKDFVSRDFFSEMVDDEEQHQHWLGTQLKLINTVGLKNFQQSMT